MIISTPQLNTSPATHHLQLSASLPSSSSLQLLFPIRAGDWKEKEHSPSLLPSHSLSSHLLLALIVSVITVSTFQCLRQLRKNLNLLSLILLSQKASTLRFSSQSALRFEWFHEWNMAKRNHRLLGSTFSFPPAPSASVICMCVFPVSTRDYANINAPLKTWYQLFNPPFPLLAG